MSVSSILARRDARLAEIDKKYPAEGRFVGGRSASPDGLAPLTPAERTKRSELIEQVKAETREALAAEAERKPVPEIGSYRFDATSADVAEVRHLLSSSSPRTLMRRFSEAGDRRMLAALGRCLQYEGTGKGGVTEEQASRMGVGSDSTADADKAKLLHAILRAYKPEEAAQVEHDYDEATFVRDLAKGADTTSAIQAAQLRKAAL